MEDGGGAVAAGLPGQGVEVVGTDEHRRDLGIERGRSIEHAERAR